MSSEQILNSKKTTIKTRRKDKVNSNKEIDKEGAKQRKEGQSQKIKLPPIIYDPDKNSEIFYKQMIIIVIISRYI